MSYEPTNWKSGDVVTSAKLNKLEQGVASAGGVIVLHEIVGDPITLNKKAGEIFSGLEAGAIFTLPISDPEEGRVMLYTCAYIDEVEDGVRFAFSSGGSAIRNYSAASEDDYPAFVN